MELAGRGARSVVVDSCWPDRYNYGYFMYRRMKVLTLAGLVVAAGCSSQSVAQNTPGPMTQMNLDGFNNVELLCDLGQVGGVLGPLAETPEGAARAFAGRIQLPVDAGRADVVGTSTQKLVVLFRDGVPVVEVLVQDNMALPAPELPGVEQGAGWSVRATQARAS